jgi:hypothetical protein
MKIQDGNGSSKDNGFADFTPVEPTKIDESEPIEEDPKSESRGVYLVEALQNTGKLPVDLNADDVKRLMNEYLGRLGKGLRV